MPPKTSLRGFLRKDILHSRLTTAPLRSRSRPSPEGSPKEACEEPHELDYLFEEDSSERKDDTPESETESLFGEIIVKEKTKEEERREKLQRFLSESGQGKNLAQNIKHIETPALKETRKELENLVTREGDATSEERLEIRKQKRSLIRKITALEAEEKATLDEISKTSPAIISEEAKKLKTKAKEISRAIAGLEGTPLKRNRQNTDNDLDGEERLRIGKTYRRPATKVTGHWGTTLHDYFPDVGGKGSNIDRNALTPEQKLLNRKELAELGEALAKAERKKKLLEK
ncbi:hypothetical protein DL98DRAFT_650521 [Cadophora sp. DSE1049]|nr:hypothetical protein DL98DRAFT_650521 [Cadophora sp. DSE1049]